MVGRSESASPGVRVRVLRQAAEDLDAISIYVESEAGSAIADAYDSRIRAKIATLASFPNRGTQRPEFGAGVLSITFEGRILILYRVERDHVAVARVLSAQRDLSDLTL